MNHHDPEPRETVDDVVKEALHGNVERRDFLRRVVRLGVASAVAYKLLDQTTAQAQTGGNQRITTFAIGEEGNPPATTRPSPNPPTYRPPTGSPKPQVTTKAVGEESSRTPTTLSYGMGEEGSRPTTMAVGEEGQGVPTTMAVGEESQGRPTTLAVGEEGKPTVTTYAVGEEQPYCPNPQPTPRPTPGPTTQAVGEEGRPIIQPTTNRVGEESKVTTHAFGEESGGGTPRKPTATTMAVGEEGTPSRPSFKVPSELYRNIPTPWKNFRRW